MENLYEILNIDKEASQEEIKKAYRKIALENHPDRSRGDPLAELRFKEASEAYSILSDPERRKAYDQGHPVLESLSDLYFHTASGKRVMEVMLPRPSAKPPPGKDIFMKIELPWSIKQQGGSITFRHPVETSEQITIVIPEESASLPWCVLPLMGERTAPNGHKGDLYIFFTEEKETIAKEKENKNAKRKDEV